MIDFEDDKVKTLNDIEISENANLLDIMKKELTAANIPFEYKEYSGLGALVTKIGDKSNGTGTSYWQYWVNNKMPLVGEPIRLCQCLRQTTLHRPRPGR